MKIFNDGVLVEIRVCFWSGSKVLTPEDLGLKKDSISDIYNLGKKMLIPKSVIRSFRAIESKARFLVEKQSFKFPFGNARFVPKKKFPKVYEALLKHQKKYNDLVDKLIIDYDGLREEMLPIYEKAAKVACKRMRKSKDMDVFTKNFVARINTFYLPTETLKSKFSLDWNVYEIALPRMRRTKSENVVKGAIATETYQEEAKNKISSFVDEVVTSLRAETVEICDKIAESIQTGKVVKGPTMKSLKTFIDDFSELNFVGDQTIERQLKDLRDNFLSKHSTHQISKDTSLQTKLKRKLHKISKHAGNITDISSITGEYRRKISWK